MNALHSTRMKLTPKYGGPGETPAGRRVPFAETKAAITAFLRSRGDFQGQFKRGKLLPRPVVAGTPAKTDYRQTLKALMQLKSARGGSPPFFSATGGKSHLA